MNGPRFDYTTLRNRRPAQSLGPFYTNTTGVIMADEQQFDWENETAVFNSYEKKEWKRGDDTQAMLARFAELHANLQGEKETEKRFLDALRSKSKEMRKEFAQLTRIITNTANSVTKKRKKRSKNKNTGKNAEN